MTEQTNLELAKTKQSAEENPQKAPIAIGLPIFIFVVLGLLYGGYRGYLYLQDEQKLPVQEIVVSGELLMINSADIENTIRTQATGSFFALDVNLVHHLIESQDWVYSASVRKRWPSTLYIHITEQQAVAIWNNEFLLNRFGQSFDGLRLYQQQLNDNLSQKNAVLPSLYGPEGSEKTTLTGYSHMQRLLNTSDHEIVSLFLSERFAWQATLQNQIVLKLGRQEYINRIQRFIDVYPFLGKESKAIKYIDLRYDTGLAVAWENEPTTVKPETNT